VFHPLDGVEGPTELGSINSTAQRTLHCSFGTLQYLATLRSCMAIAMTVGYQGSSFFPLSATPLILKYTT